MELPLPPPALTRKSELDLGDLARGTRLFACSSTRCISSLPKSPANSTVLAVVGISITGSGRLSRYPSCGQSSNESKMPSACSCGWHSGVEYWPAPAADDWAAGVLGGSGAQQSESDLPLSSDTQDPDLERLSFPHCGFRDSLYGSKRSRRLRVRPEDARAALPLAAVAVAGGLTG
jgi:hypothetical protein